jgi:hypothetical protein
MVMTRFPAPTVTVDGSPVGLSTVQRTVLSAAPSKSSAVGCAAIVNGSVAVARTTAVGSPAGLLQP